MFTQVLDPTGNLMRRLDRLSSSLPSDETRRSARRQELEKGSAECSRIATRRIMIEIWKGRPAEIPARTC
jgi:hypothetical protein